jgi:serine/threonine-protein kinase
MISNACTPFVNALRQARLLSDAQLAEVTSGFASERGEARDLARELVRRDWLTPYQVEKLARGQGGQLVLGKYVLLERLGEGGMGQVFKARHRVMERLVALKIIRPDLLHHPGAVRRFHQEIKAVAQLSHPNIVLAHDADQDGDTHFLVMEYVAGVDLKRLVQDIGALPVAHACEYIRQAASGLRHAHERGLVHRDLKPGNLLLTGSRESGMESAQASPRPPIPNSQRPTIKILDLGLALLHPDGSARPSSTDVTKSGALIGTPDYMAPEQAINARTVDIRADLYSLGCTLYYLLTAHAPFEDASLLEKLFKHKFEPPPPLASLRSDVPAEVAAIVHKLMAKEPENRYQTPAQLVEALTPFCSGGDSFPVRGARPKVSTNPAMRATSTFGCAQPQPETMSAPDAIVADVGNDPTSKAFVSLDRMLADLFPAPSSEAAQRPLPGISSVSEFVAWDKQLDTAPQDAPPQRRWLRTGLLLAGVVLLGVAAGLAWTWRNRVPSDAPVNPAPPPNGNLTGEATLTASDIERARKEAEDRAARETPPIPTPPETVAFLRGLAKPVRAAPEPDTATTKSDAGPAEEPRGEAHASAGDVVSISVPSKQPLGFASFTPDTARVLVGGEDFMSIYELGDLTPSRKPLATFKYTFNVLLGDKPLLRAALAPKGDRVWLTTTDRPVVKAQVRPPGPVLGIYEPSSPEPQTIYPCDGPSITCLAAVPTDPALVMTGNQAGVISVWEMGDAPRRNRTWSRHREVVEYLALAGDGKRAISADRGGKLWVWDLNNGEPLCELSGHAGALTALAIANDGGTAASAGVDHTVRLWDVNAVKELRRLPERFAAATTCLALSTDGKQLLTGGNDGTVRLWGTDRAALLRSWQGNEAAVVVVAFAPQGDAVFAVSRDCTLRRWGYLPSAGSYRPPLVTTP